MKAKRLRIALLYVLAALFTAVAGFALSACNKEPEAKAGDEAGVYYYDAEDDVYHVTLGEDLSLKLDIRGTTTTGVFSREGEKLTFNYETKEAAPELPLEAEYRDNAVILSYDGAEMRFLRKEYYTVKFEVEAGSVSDVSVLNGKTVAKPADPVRDGYRFYGWYTDENCTTPFLFGTQAVREDTTLYGHWAKQTEGELVYTVDFDLGYEGAEEIPAMDTVGGKLYHVQTPERDGHVFSGWWVSMYESRDKLSYAFADGETEFKANTTLFALWDNDAPTVNVNANGASWASVGPAVNYEYEVTGPEGFRTMHETIGSTNLAIDFANAPAGEYTVKVTANGKTAVRSYANKTLERVSLFTVAEPSVLLFNNVEHATKYLLTVDCGNPAHNHTELDNGNSTHYSFVNCEMQQGGIKFKVKAVGNGYASSESEWFVYDRTLGAVTGLTVDETEEKAVWNSVPFATNYIVSVNCGNSSHTHDLVDNGSATSFSLKNCGAGKITVKVYPKTKGYNSPLAAEYEYEKKSLASPDGLQVNGSTLTWNGVQGANGYEVRVGDQTMNAAGTSLDLSTSSVSWTAGGDYSISVRAMGQGSVTSSVWSDELDVRYQAMGESLTYYRNRVSWKPVVGATRYEVKVNGGQIVNVDEGNSAEVTLTRAGDNTIEVRFTDGKKYSEWVKLSVYAYTVEFDARSGQSVPSQYVAAGDKVTLPETTRTGYEIDGWYNAPGGAADNAKEYTDEYFAEGRSIMLYANWTPKHYIVKYYDTKGTAGTAEVVFGQPFKFEVPVSESGDVFYGWYSRQEGYGTQYTDTAGESLGVWDRDEEDVTVYAYWASALLYTPVVVSGQTVGYAVTKGVAIDANPTLHIPAEYNDLPVVTINSLAFDSCFGLTEVSIPDTVTSISTNAFRNCRNIEAFNIYTTNTVDEDEVVYASDDSGIVYRKKDETGSMTGDLVLFPVAIQGAVTVPEGVTSISEMAISAADITKLVLPSTLVKLETNAIYACQKLTEVEFKSPAAGWNMELTISAGAFYSCANLKSVSFPVHLGATNFSGDSSVFDGCTELDHVEIAAGNGIYSSLDGMILTDAGKTIAFCPVAKSGLVTITDPKIEKIGASAFADCARITEVVIPASLTSVEAEAFRGCTALTKVTFKGNAALQGSIGDSAFAELYALKEVIFEEGCSVSSIASDAFRETSIETLTLPGTIETVGSSAFEGCEDLTTLVMTNGDDETKASIGANAFKDCAALVNVSLSKNLSSLASNAFAGCTGIAAVTLDQDNETYSVVEGVLFNKAITSIVYYPAAKTGTFELPDTITVIDSTFFQGNTSLEGIVIPNTVTEVSRGAFKGCTALETVIFEEGGTATLNVFDASSDSYAVFGNCPSLRLVHFPANLEVVGGYAFYNNKTTEEEPTALTTVEFGDETHESKLKEIGSRAFYGNWNLTTVNFPETLTSFYAMAFSYTGLTSVHIRADWTYRTAFQNCKKLAEITFDDSIATLTNEAFSGTGVKNVVLPSSLTNTGTGTFSGSALEQITWGTPCVVTTIGKNAFQNCTSLGAVSIPASVTSIGVSAFNGCTSLSSLTFEKSDDAKTLVFEEETYGGSASSSAFGGTAFTSVELPARVTKIPKYLFAGTASMPTMLETLTFEAGSAITEIGQNAFEYSNLKSFTVPASVKSIGTYAFRAAAQLASVTFQTGEEGSLIAKIDNYVFDGASALRSIELPDSVTSIGSYAFRGCSNLASVTMNKVTSVGSNAFENCALLQAVTAGEIATVGSSAFKNCAVLDGIDLQKVTSLGTGAFEGCAALSSVTLNAALKSIGSGAFKNCAGLTSVALPAGLTSFSASAFEGCTSLAVVTVSSAEGVTANYAAEGNVLYDAAKTTLLFVPFGLTDKVTVPGTVTTISKGVFALTNVTEVEFAEGEAELTIEGGSTGAFENSAIETITLPARLAKLGYRTFYGSSIASVTFTDGGETELTIEGGTTGAFEGTKLSSVTLPARLVKLGYRTFYGSSIASVTFTDGDKALVIEGGTTGAFEGTKLSSLTLPERISEIGQNAFKSTVFSSVTFPAKLQKIGESAFESAGLTAITFNEKAELTEIGNSAFLRNEIEKVDLPASVQRIGVSAFRWNNLTSGFVIPKESALNYIGSSAFANCLGLKEIFIPKGVDSLTDSIFNGDAALSAVTFAEDSALGGLSTSVFVGTAIEKIVLPATLESIDDKAFYNLSTLTSVTFAGEDVALESIGEQAFDGTGLTKFSVPASVAEIGKKAFANTSALTSVTFEGTLITAFEDGVFENSGLTSFTYPENVTDPGEAVFNGCKSLATLTFPTTWTAAWKESSSYSAYSRGIFTGMTGLKTIVVPAGNPSYQTVDGVLFNADATTLLYYPLGREGGTDGYRIPDTVTTIGPQAFYENPVLTKVIIPGSVTVIRNQAFGSNSGGSSKTVYPLSEVVFEEGNEKSTLHIGKGTGSGVEDSGSGYAFAHTALKSVKLPKRNVLTIYQNAFSDCVELTKVEFDESTPMTKFPKGIFDGCIKLSSLNYPAELADISERAFTDTAIREFYLPDTVQEIQKDVFGGNVDEELGYQGSPLTKIVFPKNFARFYYASSYGTSSPFGGMADRLTELDFSACDTFNTIPAYFMGGKGASDNKIPNLTTLKLAKNTTEIGDYAFLGCSKLTSVDLRTTAKIGTSAFSYTGLTSVSLPQNLSTVGNAAFSFCLDLESVQFAANGRLTNIPATLFRGSGLVSAEIPDYVTSIGNYAFADCPALQEVTIPSSVKTFGADMFENCTALMSVKFASDSGLKTLESSTFQNTPSLAEVVLPDGMTSIGGSAFTDSGIEGLQLPKNLTSIGSNSFSGSAIAELEIPNTVSSIGSSAFANTQNLTRINLVDTAVKSVSDSTFANSGLTEVYLPNITKIGKSAFQGCASLQKVSFGQGLETIGEYAFAGCAELEEFVLPLSLQTIGNAAFEGVKKVGVAEGSLHYAVGEAQDVALYSSDFKTLYYYPASGDPGVILRSGLETIAPYAFSHANIVNVIVPATVKTIGAHAFDGSAVQTVTFNEAFEGETAAEERVIEEYAFTGSSIAKISIPDGFVKIGRNAFANCLSLTEATIGDSVELIDQSAFSGCAALDKIVLPAHLKEIGNSAFAGAKLSQAFTLEMTSLERLGSEMFSPTANLTKVVLSENATYLGNNVFNGLTALKEIEIDENATFTTIGESAFMNTSIGSISIPKSVKTIGKSAFEGCKLLRTVTIAEESALASVASSSYSAAIADNVFRGCESLESFAYPEGYKGYVSAGMFDGCTALASVTLCEGMGSKIGSRAFADSGIAAIEIPSTIASIDTEAFTGTTKLQEIVIPDTVTSLASPSSLAKGLFEGSGIVTAVIGDGVKDSDANNRTNDRDMFKDCASLTSVTLGAKIARIRKGTFSGCTSLQEITFRGDLAAIETLAFENCTAFETFRIPQTVTSIEAEAFKGWQGTQTLEIPYASASVLPAGWNADWSAGCGAVLSYLYA